MIEVNIASQCCMYVNGERGKQASKSISTVQNPGKIYFRGSNCPGTSGTLPEFQSKNLSRTETVISLLLSRKLCLVHE